MSETIPEWARLAAKEVIREIFVDPLASMERPIARALMAEREATELARDERAAKIADAEADGLKLRDGPDKRRDPLNKQIVAMKVVARDIASAIRDRSKT